MPAPRRIDPPGGDLAPRLPSRSRTTALLSYLHGFHAGNHADVFKHAILTCLLDALIRKPKPLVYLESHAGAGCYDLTDARALKTGESSLGIGRLWPRRQAFPQLARYLETIARLDPDGGTRLYPGSPMLAAELLRPDDRLILMERHPAEARTLETRLGADRRIGIHRRDGLEGMPALVPPKPSRGLVLIDPPYEQVSEYRAVADALIRAHGRWPTGVYALWYPRLGRARDRSDLLLERIQGAIPDGLVCELSVRPASDDLGMHGSGMLILNPPWGVDEGLRELLPRLAAVLADETASPDFRGWRLQALRGATGSR